MKEITEQEALSKAAAYCSSAEHCTAEVVAKLDAWGIPAEGQARILARLVQEHYIDEARYARFYINDKFRFNKWGRNKIIQGLRAKKIPASVYAVELEGIDKEDYLDILRSLLEAKRRDVKARNSYERDCKLIRFALGRGYEMEAIRRCLSVSDEFMD